MMMLRLLNGFSMWLVAMGGHALNAIMTNQCETMKRVIKEVMLIITHKFCMWHILYKVPEKLKGL